MASWIPDKEYSNKHVFRLSMLTLLAILFLSFYSFNRKPQSYTWDLDFNDAPIDEVTGDFLITKKASMDGIYNISLWADSTPGEHIRIIFSENDRNVRAEWKISEGVVRLAQDEYGSRFDSPWEARASTVWKIYSSSRDQKVYIRITYWKSYPDWPS